MKEALIEVFTDGSIWGIFLKVILTVIMSGLAGIFCTLLGKLIAKNKNSRVRRYAKTCVEAAEMKFPNEGKKMGPEKMAYVMDQLAIKFPKIKENTYLYNIAEAAVYELNREKQQEEAIKEFEEKYGEKPLAVQTKHRITSNVNSGAETSKELEEESSTQGTTRLKSF